MELQFQNDRIECCRQAVCQIKSDEVSEELRVPDGLPDIGRILAVWGQVILRSKEWRGDTASASGGIMVYVLYAPEDGSDPRSLDTWIPFHLRWDLPAGERDGIIQVSPLLRYTDGRVISPRKVMLRAGVSAMGRIYCPAEACVPKPDEIPEDVKILLKTYPVQLPREAGEKTVTLEEELPVQEVQKILSCTLKPQLIEQRITDGKALFRGVLGIHLVYFCLEGRIRTSDLDLPFSQYQELEHGFQAEASLRTAVSVTGSETTISENGAVRIKCGLTCQYVVIDRVLLQIPEDAYSCRRSVETVSEALGMTTVLETKSDKLEFRIPLPEGTGEPTDLAFYTEFPETHGTDQGIRLEFSGSAQVLCEEENGMFRSHTANWKQEQMITAGESAEVSVIPEAATGTFFTNGSDGPEIRGEVTLKMLTTGDHGISAVRGLILGELNEPDPGRPSLILCRADGRDLWNIAKTCGSSVEAIRELNHIEEEPGDNAMLLIPVI